MIWDVRTYSTGLRKATADFNTFLFRLSNHNTFFALKIHTKYCCNSFQMILLACFEEEKHPSETLGIALCFFVIITSNSLSCFKSLTLMFARLEPSRILLSSFVFLRCSPITCVDGPVMLKVLNPSPQDKPYINFSSNYM